MAFVESGLALLSPACNAPNSGQVFRYTSLVDTTSTIVASGYFNSTVAFTGTSGYQFQQYDLINPVGTNGIGAWYYVSSASGVIPVTLTLLPTS